MLCIASTFTYRAVSPTPKLHLGWSYLCKGVPVSPTSVPKLLKISVKHQATIGGVLSCMLGVGFNTHIVCYAMVFIAQNTWNRTCCPTKNVCPLYHQDSGFVILVFISSDALISQRRTLRLRR